MHLYENLVHEVEDFVPPEECLKSEFLRQLSHPAIILRFIPESAFEKGPRNLPWQLQFPGNQLPAQSGSSQVAMLAYIRNTLRNFLLYRHLCQSHLANHRPLAPSYEKLTSLSNGRCKDWRVGDLIDPLPSDERYQNCLLRVAGDH